MSRPLVPSLLQAIVVTDGEAIVLHVGERPYVVTESGQVHLSTAPLTGAQLDQLLDELVPASQRAALLDTGATQFALPDSPQFPGERFAAVVAQVAGDAWVEVRREEAAANVVPAAGHPANLGRRRADRASSGPSTVVPLVRNAVRPPAADMPRPADDLPTLESLLRLAAARGASALYLHSGEPPALRLDGDVVALDGGGALTASDVEALLLSASRERDAEARRSHPDAEWLIRLPGLGDVRCLRFQDHSGPGGVFRLLPARVATADQLGLPRELVRLADGDGLVLVAGARSSGRRTLLAAMIDQINRGRKAHVVSIGREVVFTHAHAMSTISQREAAGAAAMAGQVRAALREDPDVLVIEELASAELVGLALDAAVPGRLVVGGTFARSVQGAIDGILDLTPPAGRPAVQLALAHALRGAVAQALVRRIGGGRVAARELLLHTAAVAGLLADGRTSQLPQAIEAGRALGMGTLNDALAGLVRSGVVDVVDACAAAADRPGLLSLLERLGVDVSRVGRLA